MSDSLDLKRFKFPTLDKADIAFGTLGADPQLLTEAKRRGYYNGNLPGNEMFSKLFFEGGRAVFKEGLPKDFKAAAWPYLRALMGSWDPKHEEKDAICGMLLDELVSEVK